jgi:hypothetical protein
LDRYYTPNSRIECALSKYVRERELKREGGIATLFYQAKFMKYMG